MNNVYTVYLLAYYMTNDKKFALGFYNALISFKYTFIGTQKCNHSIYKMKCNESSS